LLKRGVNVPDTSARARSVRKIHILPVESDADSFWWCFSLNYYNVSVSRRLA